jgi:hypothetical protein
VPPLDPPGPFRAGALDDRDVHAAGPDGVVAVPEGGCCFLQRVERRLVLAGAGRGMGMQPGECLGGQVGQAGTAVDQQRPAEHARQLVLAVADLAAVTPLIEHCRGLGCRRVDGTGAEDELGQVQAVEHAQVLEVSEAGNQVGQRDQERAHGRLGRQHLPAQELLAGGTGQPGPVPAGPGPVCLPGIRAVLQDDPGRVRCGAPVNSAVIMVQDSRRLIQRPASRLRDCQDAGLRAPRARLRRSPAGPIPASARTSPPVSSRPRSQPEVSRPDARFRAPGPVAGASWATLTPGPRPPC